jgi:FdrA protein
VQEERETRGEAKAVEAEEPGRGAGASEPYESGAGTDRSGEGQRPPANGALAVATAASEPGGASERSGAGSAGAPGAVGGSTAGSGPDGPGGPIGTGQAAGGYVRALFGGGTLALQAVAGLQLVCDPLFTNVPLRPEQRLGDPRRSEGHCVVDLGADELTAGRPHPMLEPAILVERLLAEAADPEVALVLFDLVLGDGAHPDPAAIIAPAVATALADPTAAGRGLRVVALLQGTAGDPQGVDDQAATLVAAGALVCRSVEEAVGEAWRVVTGRGAGTGHRRGSGTSASDDAVAAGAGAALTTPFAAVNVGLEGFHASLVAQGVSAVHVDWRPPAGGDTRLLELLRRMR